MISPLWSSSEKGENERAKETVIRKKELLCNTRRFDFSADWTNTFMVRSTVVLHIDGVGPVLFERSKRAKCLNITVNTYAGVRVAVPYGVPFKKAERIVESKKAWIRKGLKRIEDIKDRHEALLKQARLLNKTEARKKLLKRLEELSGMYGFSHRKIFIRNQKTRWGSCSNRNNINLNIKLTLLPDELMDYVILHELVHTRIKNHSQAFWAELDKVAKNAKWKQRRLKKYGLGLM